MRGIRVFLDSLPNPDQVGTAEYRALHELLNDVAGGALDEGLDKASVFALLHSSLDETATWVQELSMMVRAEESEGK